MTDWGSVGRRARRGRKAAGALAIATSLWVTGCGTSLQYIDNSGKRHEPRGDPSRIKVLYKEPTEKYELLDTINWDYYQPGFRRPAITDVLTELRQKAWQVGGDAIIVRGQEVASPQSRNLLVLVDVIRFETQP
jgi:hypothetical protein